MDNVIPFPEKHPDSKDGYCNRCYQPVHIDNASAWPEACPHCRTTPFALQSWKPDFGSWPIGFSSGGS